MEGRKEGREGRREGSVKGKGAGRVGSGDKWESGIKERRETGED